MKKNYGYYLINLDRAKDRLKLMTKEFEKNNIEFNRIPAIDYKEININSYSIKNLYDRDLVPGEIGCYLSHLKTLKIFLNSSEEFAIILEDDAILEQNFDEVIYKTINSYNELDDSNKWDILKLKNGKRRNIKIKNIDDRYFIGACGTSIPITTIGAIWTRSAAKKFLNKVGYDTPIIRRPIDCELQHPWEYDLLIYNLLPSVIKTAEFETQIQIDKNLRKSNFIKQISYEVKRIIPKYSYLIKRHGLKKFYMSFIAKKTEKVL
ncbi:glycosyltransferase family 25 protein [Chishuiella sp.]|uniref:glycosyltransferase family 25 protein n=1 Tax=Chishuiella sp. TaxID=1969467 RepID=UPI0028A62E23|nr:glycosyltransferase family 25 protein [Chishuiella sp.]